jgi:hypothetical protein
VVLIAVGERRSLAKVLLLLLHWLVWATHVVIPIGILEPAISPKFALPNQVAQFLNQVGQFLKSDRTPWSRRGTTGFYVALKFGLGN